MGMEATTYASITWNSIEVGTELPTTSREVTAALVVGGAIAATHDYENVHHDHLAAKAAGADDVFMNILTTNGLVGKYLTDWAGPESTLKKIALKLAVPNYPNDTLVFSGHVKKKYKDNDECLVEIEFVGKNNLGYHALGEGVLALPRG
jgi:hypothetical protein